MSLNKIFIFFTISFLSGIFISNILFDFNLTLIFFVAIVIFFLFMFIILKKYHYFIVIIVFWIFLWLIYSQNNNYFIKKYENYFKDYYSKEVYIIWKVDYLYKKEEKAISYVVDILSINNISQNHNLKFLLKTPPNIKLDNNENIWIKTNIEQLKNFTPNFNYVRFMQSKDIYFVVNYPKMDFLWKDKSNNFENNLSLFRQKIIDIIYSLYPKNEAVLLAWILIWAREDLPKEMSQNFNNSWLTHLIAVSWFNITIIIIFLWFLFKFLPMVFRAIIITIFIIFFYLIVWDNPPVIRASIMWIIWYYILISGRKADWLSLMLFTALIMVLFNPLYLNYDISFHLSFLALIWLLYFQNFWNKVFYFLPSFFAIKESFVLTLSAMTTTLPIMIFNFGQFSILAPIANMLVWWIIPFAMFFWFLSIVSELISSKIWFVIGFINYFFLKFINEVASFFGGLDFSIIKMDLWFYALYIEIVYFMLLVFVILYFKKEKNPTK